MSRKHILPALRSARLVTKLLLATAIVAVLGTVATVSLAAAAKPGITVQTSPASQSVTRGQTVSYTITVTSTNGFAGVVTLSASGLPNGASAAFAPSSITLTSGGKATSTMSVTTTSTTPAGNSTLTVTGTSGKINGSVTAGLTVNVPLSGSISMTATPATVSVAPGSTAVYTIQLARVNLPAPVTFSLIGGLPAGAAATYSPNPTTGNSATLQITTASTTNGGTYNLNLLASGRDPSNTSRSASASVQLDITTKGKDFSISGDVAGLLAPGVSQPVDLFLTNPNNQQLSITNLTVTVKSVARNASAIGVCSVADYKVTQYSGPYPLVVPGRGSTSLSNLGVPSTSWPKITMIDTATNQDGCKGATVTLAYSGSGQGS